MSMIKDLDAKEKNVDRAIDMLLAVQKENGIETNMRKALFDPTTNARINRFQRARLEQDGVDMKPYGVGDCNGCNKCEKCCDICDSCETCREYINGECDGCGYSRTFNGTSYGFVSEQTVTDTMSTEDSMIYNELDQDIPDETIHLPDRKFSIMDY